MKKIISFVLSFAMIFAVLPISICAVGKTAVSLVDTDDGSTVSAGAGKIAKVYLKISEAELTAAAQITINYDKALELIYVDNGKVDMSNDPMVQPYFNTMYQSAIYGADFGAPNGVYIFNGAHDMSDGSTNVKKNSGYFATLSFKVPDDAKVGDKFNVSISRENSTLVRIDDNGVNTALDFSASGVEIVVKEDNVLCATHDFKEIKLSDADYINNGFSYKECSACHIVETEKAKAWSIDALGYEGIAIRYAGNPTGIAATFTVNIDNIKEIELLPKYKIEIGTIALCNGKEIKTVYYGEGKTQEIKNGKIFGILTGIDSIKDKAEFCAYVTIKDTETGNERTDYLQATLSGEKEFSIYDIVVRMDIRSYPSEASQKYLNTVLNGF